MVAETGSGAHLDGVSLPHLPEVVEPGFLWYAGRRERQVLEKAGGVNRARHMLGAGGANTYIHYDSHASNESNKVKRESPTGKRKQTVLRWALGRGREKDGPTNPIFPPPRAAPSQAGAPPSPIHSGTWPAG